MKNVIVYHLPIPSEIVDHVCSFIYYRVDETIARNKIKYNRVICDLFYTVRLEREFYFYGCIYTTLFIYNVQCRFDIQIYICCKCGNYARPTYKCKCTKLKCN
jgi:hypothetical protein